MFLSFFLCHVFGANPDLDRLLHTPHTSESHGWFSRFTGPLQNSIQHGRAYFCIWRKLPFELQKILYQSQLGWNKERFLLDTPIKSWEYFGRNRDPFDFSDDQFTKEDQEMLIQAYRVLLDGSPNFEQNYSKADKIFREYCPGLFHSVKQCTTEEAKQAAALTFEKIMERARTLDRDIYEGYLTILRLPQKERRYIADHAKRFVDYDIAIGTTIRTMAALSIPVVLGLYIYFVMALDNHKRHEQLFPPRSIPAMPPHSHPVHRRMVTLDDTPPPNVPPGIKDGAVCMTYGGQLVPNIDGLKNVLKALHVNATAGKPFNQSEVVEIYSKLPVYAQGEVLRILMKHLTDYCCMHPLAALLHGIFQPGCGGPDIVKYIVDKGCSKEVWRKPNCWQQVPPPIMAWTSLPAEFLHRCRVVTATALATFTNSLSFDPSISDSGTVTPSLPVAIPAVPQIPVGNCTFLADYYVNNPFAGNIIESFTGKAMKNLPCNITRLSFRSPTFGLAEVKALLNALPQYNLTRIDFNGAVLIGDPEVELLAPVIGLLSSLTQLEFGQTLMGDAGAKALTLVLPKLLEIYRLSFSGTKITADGALAILPYLKQMPKLAVLFFSGIIPQFNTSTQATFTTAFPGVGAVQF